MPRYVYRAKKGPTEVVDGTIEASSVDEAVEKLDQIGLLPVNISEFTEKKQVVSSAPKPVETAPPNEATKKAAPRREFFRRLKSSDITLFGRQLASLIRAGVPILKALWIISEQTESPRLKEVLLAMQEEIRNGKTFSSTLEHYPKNFPPIYIAMVRAGEDSGTLQEALGRISEYRRKQEEIFSRVRTAMAYPALMAVTGIGTIVFMLTFVIPRLTGLFSTMGAALPLPTRILMKISSLFASPIFWYIVGVFLMICVIAARAQRAKLGLLWSRLSLRLPALRTFVVKAELARFARTLELLIKSGIPILRAIEVTTPVLGNEVLRRQFAQMQTELAGGGSLGKGMRESGVFPPFVSNLISVGEESGKLDESLAEIADFYERETDEAIKVLTSLVEPLMILVMGLIVGFIVIAMLLPMFELNMMVK